MVKYVVIIAYWVLMVVTVVSLSLDPEVEGTFTKEIRPFGMRGPRKSNSTENADPKIVKYTMKYIDESTQTEFLLKLSNIVITLYPLFACLYSKSIYDCKCLT